MREQIKQWCCEIDNNFNNLSKETQDTIVFLFFEDLKQFNSTHITWVAHKWYFDNIWYNKLKE